jgi:hypothetical protein
MRRGRKRTGVFIVAALMVLPTSASPLAAQPQGRSPNSEQEKAPEMLDDTRSIPRQYRSWSLFLICNSSWLQDRRAQEIGALYEQFMGFGRALGREHAALWFWNRVPTKIAGNPMLVSYVSANRHQAYCQKLGLDPFVGPHIVVTRTYPDLSAEIVPDVVIAFDNLRPDDIDPLLRRLTGQIVQDRLDQGEIESLAWRQRWKRSFKSVLCAVAPVLAQKLKVRIRDIEIEGALPDLCKP